MPLTQLFLLAVTLKTLHYTPPGKKKLVTFCYSVLELIESIGASPNIIFCV